MRMAFINRAVAAQHALAPDAAPLRFAAQVKRKPLARLVNSRTKTIHHGFEEWYYV